MQVGSRRLAVLLVRWVTHPLEFTRRLRSFLRGRFLIDFRNSEVCLVSFPKCGRTWLRVVIGKAIHDYYGIENSNQIFYNNRLAIQAGLPQVYISHGGAVPHRLGHPTPSIKSYASKKVILLVRDVRDLLVSWYYQKSRREKVYSGSISEFIRDIALGVPHIASFYKAWYENRTVPTEFILIRYEDMHVKPFETAIEIMSLIGAGDVPDAVIRSALAFAEFDNMQKLEQKGTHPTRALQPIGGVDDPNALKFRKGKIGGYKDQLTDSDLQYIEQAIRDAGAPVEWLYYTGESLNN